MATPYAHSFCDIFLGALRHTTPSILRQRGSAATEWYSLNEKACLGLKHSERERSQNTDYL